MPKSRGRQKRSPRPYAAPPPKKRPKESPSWYGFLVLGLMGLGVAIIVLNYMSVMPGGTQQHWLWIGLGIIAAGFGAATQWR
ncbi:MAG TPA: cell division protein CrgA [Actinomycetota bacterium]|nr:cell division protein CrgA [Actinomycetota bacterium]